MPIVGNGEYAGADKGPCAGSNPGFVIGSGREAKDLASGGVEEAPCVQQVHGRVADADAAEVDDSGQPPVVTDEEVLRRQVGVYPAGGFAERRAMAQAPPVLANAGRVE